MHPILFEIPLPAWQLPFLPLLLVCSAIAVLVSFLGWRARAKDLLLMGAGASVVCSVLALRLRGESLTVTNLPIYGYGTLLACSFILGWIVTMTLARRGGVSQSHAAGAFFATALSALAGARILYTLTNLSQFEDIATVLDFHGGGLVAYGGFIGGFLGAGLYSRATGMSLLLWADAAAPAVALGLCITRIGCYLFGCDFGKPFGQAAPAWLRAVGTFPRWDYPSLPIGTGAPAWQRHVDQGWIDYDAVASLPVHPTQLYESAVGLVLFLCLLALWQRRQFPGQVLVSLAIGYGVARYVLELWRDDPERGAFGPAWSLHVGTSVALTAIAAAMIVGPLRSLVNPRWRTVASGIAVLVPPLAYMSLRPEALELATVSAWSTSQWLGIATAVAAGAAWHWLSHYAPKAPSDDRDEALHDTT